MVPRQHLTFLVGAKMIPHPEKAHRGGEDAYFVRSGSLFSSLGVADGVGGWASQGIDPGVYARQLMAEAYDFFEMWDGAYPAAAPVGALSFAHRRTQVPGSSTAVVLTLHGGTLHTANLGDSGFLLIRANEIVFASPPQQHAFNFPFQLQHGGRDRPAHADVAQLLVQLGDVIVVGSDGLFDNLFNEQILEVIKRTTTPGAAATGIAELAHEKGGDPTWRSPFSVEAEKAGYARLSGGKMDDITVLVAEVIEGQQGQGVAAGIGFRPVLSAPGLPPSRL